MRRATAHLAALGIGAALWAAMILLPGVEQAHAQMALLPHLHPAMNEASVAAQVRDMIVEAGDVDRELECLALNVYFEARGEPESGKVAVAAVTINRVADPAFPDSICAVVRQGAGRGRQQCQFSWACDRYGDRPRDRSAWESARAVAFAALFEDEPDPTDGATYFHATRVRPAWARTMVKVGHIGRHLYYRQRQTAERETPDRRS